MAMRDGGRVKLCQLANTAQPGFMPVESLVVLAEPFCAYRTAGVTRRYAAKGANAEFNFILRCFNMVELPAGAQYAVMEDGEQYRIDTAEPMFNEDALDLTLIRVEEFYAVATE